MEILKENEQIDDLMVGGLKIIQKAGIFRYGTDAVLLSKFAEINEGDNVLDIGTGSGILPILLSNKAETAHFTGIDVQDEVIEMAKRSATLNNLEERIDFLTLDINMADSVFDKKSFDAIVTNPPYKRKNSGIKNGSYKLYIARNEELCTLSDIMQKAAYLLKDKGRFYMVQRPDRLADAIEEMRKVGIEPKLLTLVYSNEKKPPVMFLIKGILGAGKELKVTPPIVLEAD